MTLEIGSRSLKSYRLFSYWYISVSLVNSIRPVRKLNAGKRRRRRWAQHGLWRRRRQGPHQKQYIIYPTLPSSLNHHHGMEHNNFLWKKITYENALCFKNNQWNGTQRIHLAEKWQVLKLLTTLFQLEYFACIALNVGIVARDRRWNASSQNQLFLFFSKQRWLLNYKSKATIHASSWWEQFLLIRHHEVKSTLTQLFASAT